MRSILLHALVALAISAAALAVYHHWLAPKGPAIGVVDAVRIFKEEEGRHLQALAAGGDELQRARALDAARRFSTGFPAQLEGLERECACIVLERSTLVAVPDEVPDLTPLLRQRVRP